MTESEISPTRSRLAMAVSALAIFMANVDVSIVNIALPSMAKMYSTDANEVAAIVQSYQLTLTSFLLIAGRLSDVKSPERIIRQGFVLFTASSVLCAMAPNLGLLTLFRFIQGIGAAFMFATASVLIVRYVPSDRRGRAYSLNGLMAGVGIAMGAPIGGMLLQYLDWRWIFLINIPIGAAALIVAHFALEKGETNGDLSDFDWWGALFSFLFLAALLLGMHSTEDTHASTQSGYSAHQLLGEYQRWILFAAAAVFLVLFLVRQTRIAKPLLDLSLLKIRPLMSALCGNACYMMAVGGLALTLPFYFTLVKQLSPKDVGWLLMISPGISIIVARISGYFSDKIGPRPVCITATSTIVAASIGILTFTVSSPYTWIILLMVILGVGRALYVTALLTMVMSFSERGREGMLSAANMLIPSLGRVIGVSIYIMVYNYPLLGLSIEAAALPENVARGFAASAKLGLAVAVLMLILAVMSNSKKAETV